MNAIPRVLVATWLMILTPLAGARGATQTPPGNQPEAAQAKEAKEAKQAKEAKGSGDVSKELGHVVDAIRSYSAERRAEAVADARRASEDLDRQLQRLQEQTDQRWERMSRTARLRSQATMRDLRKRRNDLAEWSGGMRHSSGAAWVEVRSGFVKSYHELADAIRKARAQFENDRKAQPEEAKAERKR